MVYRYSFRVFRAEAKHFSRAKAFRARTRLLLHACRKPAVLIFTPLVDSIPNRNLHRPSFPVENFFSRVIAASSNVWILFIPSEISFLEILFLNVARRSCNLECTSILKRSNELIKSMEKNDRKFDESY